jgi:hypothetical protein
LVRNSLLLRLHLHLGLVRNSLLLHLHLGLVRNSLLLQHLHLVGSVGHQRRPRPQRQRLAGLVRNSLLLLLQRQHLVRHQRCQQWRRLREAPPRRPFLWHPRRLADCRQSRPSTSHRGRSGRC